MKILLAVDGSAYTKRMLSYLAAHNEFLHGDTQYVVMTVVPHVPPRACAYFSHAELQDYYRDEAEKALGPVRQFIAQQGWKVEFQHVVGHAPDVIAEAAANGHFDLVAMGSHGHSSFGGLVLGSVTQRVLAQCKTPVLIIR
jgi:nucleotide-binding universal stress UspA family protein